MSSKAFQNSKKLNGIVDVRQFGAVGDGVADDTAAIQAAVNAAQAASGTTVLMPQGTYKISVPISIVSPVSIIGMAGATIIAPNFASGSAFQIVPPSGWPYDSGVTIANLNFKASVVRTSGAYLSSNNGYYITVTRCQFLDGYNGIHLTGIAATGFYVKECIFANNTNDNILIDAATGLQGPVDVVLQDLWIHGNGPSGQSVSGVHIKAAGDITLRHVSTVWCGTGLRVQPATGNRIQALICTECFFDS
jgi:polygalacturonase